MALWKWRKACVAEEPDSGRWTGRLGPSNDDNHRGIMPGGFFFLLASFSRDRESENSENVAVTSCRKLMSDGCASFLYAWRWIRRWNGETLRWAIFGGETCERFIGGQWPRIPSGFLPLWSPAILSGRSCCCSGTRSSGILFYALFGTFSGVRFQSRILCNVKKPVWRSLIEWDEQFWERKK